MVETTVNLNEAPAETLPVVDEANKPWLELDELIAGERDLDSIEVEQDQEAQSNLEEAEPEKEAAPITEEAEMLEQPETVVFDYDQMVPLPDEREPVSVSALKDSYIDAERGAEALQAKGDELLVMRREMQQLISAAGRNVTPEMRQQIAQVEQQQLQREHGAMLAAMPEWKDATVFETARDSMFNAARRYGFSNNELRAISDHRVIAMLNALAGYQGRETKAVEAAKPVRKAAKTRRGQRAPQARKGLTDKHLASVAKSGTYDERYDAMDQLLGSS